MIGGDISAGVFWEPFATNILTASKGSRMVADSGELEWLKTGVVADAIYMSNDFVQNHREAALEFLKAYFRAIAWRDDHPAEGNKIIAAGMKMPVEDVDSVLGAADQSGTLYVYPFLESARLCGAAEGNPPFGQTNGQITEIWRTINDWWVRIGLLQDNIDPSAGIDCTLERDLAKSGFVADE
jgi:NitT/TauT family transport system substrate-binding protein